MDRLADPAERGSLRPLRDPRPLYALAGEAVRALAKDEGLGPGDRLPSERELSSALGVGRSTVREALRHLQILGLVKTIHGRGTILTGASQGVVAGLEQLDSLESLARRQGWKCGTIDVTVEPWPLTTGQGDELNREPGSSATKIERTKTRDGTPIATMVSIIPEEVVSQADLRRRFSDSIIELFRRRNTPVLDHARSHVSGGIAMPDVADRLGIAAGEPVLVLHEVFCDPTGSPFCLNINWFLFGVVRLDLVRRPP